MDIVKMIQLDEYDTVDPYPRPKPDPWTSVEDRLPTMGEEVYVFGSVVIQHQELAADVGLGYIDSCDEDPPDWRTPEGQYIRNVTHWQLVPALPEPPK